MNTSNRKIRRELQKTHLYNIKYNNFQIRSDQDLEQMEQLNLTFERKEGYTFFESFVVGFTGGTGQTENDRYCRPEKKEVFYKGNLIMFCQEDMDMGLITQSQVIEKIEMYQRLIEEKPNHGNQKLWRNELEGYTNNFKNKN